MGNIILDSFAILITVILFVNIINDSYQLLVKKVPIKKEVYQLNFIMALLNQEYFTSNIIIGVIAAVFAIWYIGILIYNWQIVKKSSTISK